MNLRIAPEHVRFRLSNDEFATLLTHGSLADHTTLGGATLDYTIHIQPTPCGPTGQQLELTTTSDTTGTRFQLDVFGDGVTRLQSGSAGKDGIQEHRAFDNGDLLTIGLEIDLHSKKGADKS